MSITSYKTQIQSVLTSLHGHQLESVDFYKYLGVELNSKLDWDQQWRIVQDKIKSIGFKTAILKNVYVSLALSHFAYSSPLLTSTSKSAIKEMTSFHRRVTSIIEINLQEQTDIHEYMEKLTLDS